VGHSC